MNLLMSRVVKPERNKSKEAERQRRGREVNEGGGPFVCE